MCGVRIPRGDHYRPCLGCVGGRRARLRTTGEVRRAMSDECGRPHGRTASLIETAQGTCQGHGSTCSKSYTDRIRSAWRCPEVFSFEARPASQTKWPPHELRWPSQIANTAVAFASSSTTMCRGTIKVGILQMARLQIVGTSPTMTREAIACLVVDAVATAEAAVAASKHVRPTGVCRPKLPQAAWVTAASMAARAAARLASPSIMSWSAAITVTSVMPMKARTCFR